MVRHTDDFWRDHNALTPRGKKFVRGPREEQYGTAAVFENFYGKKEDLLQANAKSWQLNGDGSPFHQISVGDQLYPLACQNLPSSRRGQYIQFDFP